MSSSAASHESPFTSHLLLQLEMPYRMALALAADFTEEEATRRVGDHKPLVWYLAHISITKNHLLTLHTERESMITPEFFARFGRGSDGSADFSDVRKADMLEHVAKIHEAAKEFVASLSPDDLNRETAAEAAHPLFKRLGSALTLVATHDGYHVGQIANLRRAMGKDPLFG